jgi:septal ring factor EnvC (AmiA/AmiB activator)
MNTWLPLTSTIPAASFNDNNGSYGNVQEESDVGSFNLNQKITQARDLRAEIAAKEEELTAIEGNRNGRTAELNHLRAQLRHLSFNLRRLIAGPNPPESHSSW